MPSKTPPTYTERLLSELDDIWRGFEDVIRASRIVPFVVNDPNSTVQFVGWPEWGWEESDTAHEAARMAILPKVGGWFTRFRLLFVDPIPTVRKRIDDAQSLIETWLRRDKRDHSVPRSIDSAVAVARERFDSLRALCDLLPADPWKVRAIIDTNALIDNPDVAAYTEQLGRKYMAHILPVVQREVDELKHSGRIPELREAANRANRRLKKYRDNGNVLEGARVEGQVYVRFEHIEPKSEGLPSWLDLSVPDDRFIASTLLLQSAHPGSALYVVTSDINMQTKLAAVGMPHVDPDGGDD